MRADSIRARGAITPPHHDAGYMAATFPSAEQSSGSCIAGRTIYEDWSDSEIWAYARAQNLIILSKDADFSDRILVSKPPPRVIHIRFGNMKMRDFHGLIRHQWPDIVALAHQHRLVTAYRNRIEAID